MRVALCRRLSSPNGGVQFRWKSPALNVNNRWLEPWHFLLPTDLPVCVLASINKHDLGGRETWECVSSHTFRGINYDGNRINT
jgi:hypothetical protein